jgi:DNA-binding MarR family transcriptional regulator
MDAMIDKVASECVAVRLRMLNRVVTNVYDGWLEVVPDEDGRSQPFRLTPQGRKLLEKAIPAWSEAQQQVKKVLGKGFVEQLNQAMRRVSKNALAE